METNCPGQLLSVLVCDPQPRPRCTRHIATQGAILSLNDEEVQGVIPAICRFYTLNGATWQLIIRCTSCTVKLSWGEEMGQNVCQCLCVCAPMSCLLFAGDSPSSLAAIQDLFSPSLYITANGITDALCPVLSFPPPPPPPFVSLPLPVLSPPILHPAVCRRRNCASLPGATVSPMGS